MICNSVYDKENGKSMKIQIKICTKVLEMCSLYMFFLKNFYTIFKKSFK